MAFPPPLYVPQNDHSDCEAAINQQINLELYASYVYRSMASYFDDVASWQLVEFLLQQSSKEKEHAERLIQLQNQRGSSAHPCNISTPDGIYWGNSLKALECTLNLLMTVNQSLLSLHQLATQKKDTQLRHILESSSLKCQEMFIEELGDHITNLQKMGAPESGLAMHLFNKLILGVSKKD